MDADQHQEIARCLFRESNDALFLFDPEEHRVLDVNPAGLRLTGLEKDAARRLRLRDLFDGEAPGALERLIEAYRRTGFYHARDGYTLRREDGPPIPVNVSVSRIHVEPAPLGLVVARDVSERRRAEEALRASERRYRSLVETTGVVLWTLRPDGRIAELSPAFEAITGLSRREWVGRPLAELLHPDDVAPAREFLAQAARGEAPPVAELRVLGRSATYLVLHFILAAAVGEGEAAGVMAVARDVTGRRRFEEAVRAAEGLRLAKEAAEAANRAKGEFLASLGHEVRTPLTAILGFADMLLADEQGRGGEPSRVEALQTIQRNGAHLLGLVDDILDLATVDAGRLRVAIAPCAPADVLADVVATLRGRAEEKGLPLGVEFATPVPAEVRTDALRLRQILINLLGNAIKFTDRGAVVVRVRLDRDAATGPALRFDVEDTGPGMTEGQMAHLFEPFYRAGRDRDGGPAGTGLGLAISRRLAERLGGRLTARSTAGVGSTFALTIPTGPLDGVELVARPSPSRAPAPAAAPAAAAAGLRVLVADDNEANRRVIELRLGRAGATVEAAADGAEAVARALAAAAEGRPFDAVLMDMQMPGVDGYEATRRLRDAGYAGRVVALTAAATAEDREECLRIGCDEHITKPIDWARLLAALAPDAAASAG